MARLDVAVEPELARAEILAVLHDLGRLDLERRLREQRRRGPARCRRRGGAARFRLFHIPVQAKALDLHRNRHLLAPNIFLGIRKAIYDPLDGRMYREGASLAEGHALLQEFLALGT